MWCRAAILHSLRQTPERLYGQSSSVAVFWNGFRQFASEQVSSDFRQRWALSLGNWLRPLEYADTVYITTLHLEGNSSEITSSLWFGPRENLLKRSTQRSGFMRITGASSFGIVLMN
jgi:hypothetical protein